MSFKMVLRILNSKPVIGALIFIFLSMATVLAGNIIFKQGSLTFDSGNLTVGGNLTQGYGIISNYTNANGTCIKFGDGTMQCYGYVYPTVSSVNTVFDFPLPFVGATEGAGASISAGIVPFTAVPDKFVIWVHSTTQGGYYVDFANLGIQWTAIGRWK